MIYPFWARSSLIKRSMFIFYPYKALYVNSAFSIYKPNFRKKCQKNSHPKKRLHPLRHLHPRRLHPMLSALQKGWVFNTNTLADNEFSSLVDSEEKTQRGD